MSTESRLSRLGLLHLQGKPEELQKALEAAIKEDEKKFAKLKAEHDARIAAREARLAKEKSQK